MIVVTIPVNRIRISKKQPRQFFNEESLKQLADSIQEVGQLQPVLVMKKDDNYLLIAGERRLRAIKKNKEKMIAAVILEEDTTEEVLRQIQLIENLQRENLNPLERAISIKHFIDENSLTKKEAGEKLGVPRTTLTEWLNILDVPDKYQQAVIDEDSPLSLSHITLARGLVSRTGDPTKLKQLLDNVLKYNLSRVETKEITEIYNRYLHISMEEALAAILLKRERQNLLNRVATRNNGKSDSKNLGNLITSFNNLGNILEKTMERVGTIEKDVKNDLVEEFLYIYQLLGIMIPELKDDKLETLVEAIMNRESY